MSRNIIEDETPSGIMGWDHLLGGSEAFYEIASRFRATARKCLGTLLIPDFGRLVVIRPRLETQHSRTLASQLAGNSGGR